MRKTIDRSRADQIRRELAAAEGSFQTAVGHAIRAGELLIEQKAELRHGDWLPWLSQHLPELSKRSAQNYMRLARNAQRVAHLPNVREAVAALTEKAEEPDDPVDAPEMKMFYVLEGWQGPDLVIRGRPDGRCDLYVNGAPWEPDHDLRLEMKVMAESDMLALPPDERAALLARHGFKVPAAA